eukprot:scaffold3152_cov256-Ochromonas_danica.AAC.8
MKRQGQGKQGDREMLDLISQLRTQKEGLSEVSQALFASQQEFLKKYETLRLLRQENKSSVRHYVQEMKVLALKEAELKYYEEEYGQQEHDRIRSLAAKQKSIHEARDRLQSTLDHYRQLRLKITSLQKLVTKDVEEDQEQARNLVRALEQAKRVMESEMRRPTHRKTFPTKKEIGRSQKQLQDYLDHSSQSLQTFMGEHLLSLRRQERILTGRVKEVVEQQAGRMRGYSTPIISRSLGISEEGGGTSDSLENRIAQKMFANSVSSAIDQNQDSETDDGILVLPSITSNQESDPVVKSPVLSMGNMRVARRFSILQSGEVERFQAKWSTREKSSVHGNEPQKKLLGAVEKDVIYDPDIFSSLCREDEPFRQHLLLDTNRGLGENEKKLSTIARVLCMAKGKGLDVLLLKHASLLLLCLDQLQASKDGQSNVKKDGSPSQQSPRSMASRFSALNDLSLSLRHKIQLADIARLEREASAWRQRIYRELFSPDSAVMLASQLPSPHSPLQEGCTQ